MSVSWVRQREREREREHERENERERQFEREHESMLATLMILKVLQKACKPVMCCQVIALTLAVRMAYLTDAAAKVYEHFARDITFL